MSTQWHLAASGECLGQRALKSSSGLGTFRAVGFVLSKTSRCQVQLTVGHVKRAGSKSLKIYLLAYTQGNWVYRNLSFGLVGFELTILACCEEVNDTRAHL